MMNRINQKPGAADRRPDRPGTPGVKNQVRRAEQPRDGEAPTGRKDLRDTLTLESAIKADFPLKAAMQKNLQPTPARRKAIFSGTISGGLKKLAGLLGGERDAAAPQARPTAPAARPSLPTVKPTGPRAVASPPAAPAPGRGESLTHARRNLDAFAALGRNVRAPHDVYLTVFGDLNKVITAFTGHDAEIVAATRRVTTTLRTAAREGLANPSSPHTAASIGAELQALFDLYDAHKPGLSQAMRDVLDRTMISVASSVGRAVQKHAPARLA